MLLKLGHPLLRQLSRTVEDILSSEFQATLNELKIFVIEKGGMGIA
jgi:peptide deformylase